MNLKLNTAEVQIVKNALADYQASLVGKGTQYDMIASIYDTITDNENKAASKTPRIMANKQWMFNFKTGGWNTVFAKTKRGAIAQALKEYKKSTLIPNVNTFCLATEPRLKVAMSSFY